MTKLLLEYPGRYTRRVALSNDRLGDLRDGHVLFRWKDDADHIHQLRGCDLMRVADPARVARPRLSCTLARIGGKSRLVTLAPPYNPHVRRDSHEPQAQVQEQGQAQNH